MLVAICVFFLFLIGYGMVKQSNYDNSEPVPWADQKTKRNYAWQGVKLFILACIILFVGGSLIVGLGGL
jgi:hypothetical protein